MKSIIKILLISCPVLLLAIAACKKSDNPAANPSNSSFDRKGMLTNIGNNIIIPAYQALNSCAVHLDSSVAAYSSNPDGTTLVNLQNAFKAMYIAWQSCSEFQFGPGDEQYLSENINTFPTDTIQINSNISSGSYNLAAVVNQDAKGLPGMDYLLFGVGADNNSILAKYTSDARATGRMQYLIALSAAIKVNVNSVYTSWTTGGHLNTFINATGTDIGSSTGLLINAMDFDLEILKNDKLGIPLGKQSMGDIYPYNVEACYSGISAQLALLQLEAIQNIYLGKSNVGDGLGFDDYLVSLNAQYNGGSLNDAIKSEFTTAISKMQALSDPLSAAIKNNPAAANAAYTEAQKLVVLLKTDMPSAMGVLITYNDTDGD